MRHVVATAVTIASCAILAGPATPVALSAQQPAYKRDLPDSLLKRATVSEARAIAVAKKAVPKGTVTSIELEREGGRLIYSMEMKTPGRPGIDEVNVDAKTGKMVGRVEHEGPKPR